MRELLRMQRIPLAAGALACVAVLAAELLSSKDRREGLREVAFDLVLAADDRLRPSTGNRQGPHVIVVDIDRRSLDAVGPWPWPRAAIAGLVEAIAAAKPTVGRAQDTRFPWFSGSCWTHKAPVRSPRCRSS